MRRVLLSAPSARRGAALKGLPEIARFEIIVVDDGSTDGTAGIVESLRTDIPELRLVRHGANRGYGAALRTGFAESRFDYVCFTDSDLQVDARELSRFIPYLAEHDAVIGYRERRNDPFFRRLYSRAWNALMRLVLGIPYRDVGCAFKVFRRDAVRSLSLFSEGTFISPELLSKLHRSGSPIKEIPVSHRRREQGKATGALPRVVSKAFLELFRFLWARP